MGWGLDGLLLYTHVVFYSTFPFYCHPPSLSLLLFISRTAIDRDEQVIVDCSKTKMSSKKTAKIVVKSEVTTVTSKKRKRGKDDGSDAEDDAIIRSTSAVKMEESAVTAVNSVKSEVKSEVTEMPAKKRKRGNRDGYEDVIDASSDRTIDASVRKKKKQTKQTKKHASTEPGCTNIFGRLQH
jgi:hypothetical protein